MRRALLPSAIALLLAAGAARAQFTPPAVPIDPREEQARARVNAVDSRGVATVSGPVDAATYVIGPGDVLRVFLTGPMRQEFTLEIGPEGTAMVPEQGAVRLGGLTLEQARAELRRRIGSVMRRAVRVDVELARVRLLRVYLSGDLSRHGSIELPATARVSDALEGGGLVLATGSRRNIEVRHRDGTIGHADLDRFIRSGDIAQNPVLRDDDVLFVPVAREWVYVDGAVARPGRFERNPGDSLRTLLRLGGGPLPVARRERALLVRWSSPAVRESTWVDLDDVQSGAFNPLLRDGDRLLVYQLSEYHRFESASIYGEVVSPGVYPLVSGVTRLSDLVRSAGGFLPRADLSAIHVFRPRPEGSDTDAELERLSRLSRNEMTSSEYEVLRTRLAQRRPDFRVDWHRLTSNADNDIVLMAGDVVRVEPSVASVRVDGQVKRPGLVRYEAGARLDRYVETAGGYSGRAARSQTLVTRAVTGQTLPAREVGSIEPGDLIWVPERPDRTLWQNFGTLITVAAQVATIIIAVRRN